MIISYIITHVEGRVTNRLKKLFFTNYKQIKILTEVDDLFDIYIQYLYLYIK